MIGSSAKAVIRGGIHFLTGALLLSLISIPQKLLLGVPYANPKGYIVPVLFGGASGLILGWYHQRSNKTLVELTESQNHMRSFIDHAGVLIQSFTAEGRLSYVNETWKETMGYSDEDLDDLVLQEIIHPDYWQKCSELFNRVVAGETIEDIESIFITKDGRYINVIGNANAQIDSAGQLYTRGIFRDVTQRKMVESDLQLLAKVFDNTAEGVIITDAEPAIVKVNEAFTDVTGYAFEEVRGKNPNILKSGRHDQKFYELMWAEIEKHGRWRGEIWNRRKTGEIYPEWLTISTVRDTAGQVTHFIGVFTDITVLKLAQERLHHLATHDPLTGLSNRMLFLDRLDHSIKKASRTGEILAVLFVDLDDFKKVNDTYGHFFGDHLLRVIGERLKSLFRASDTVARLGGDEFTILMEDVQSPEAVSMVAGKVARILSEPYKVQDQEVQLTASVGTGIYPQDGVDINSLLKSADMAMYARKEHDPDLSDLMVD